jgi:septal ring factor EnvC (AmiA/AmiB activator)
MDTKTVTTNELMSVMQDMLRITSDRFDQMDERMDRVESRIDNIETHIVAIDAQLDRTEVQINSIENELKAIKAKLLEHDLQLAELRRSTQQLIDKHSAYINDIADILDRIARMERQVPHASKEEIYEIQAMLQKLVNWALKTAKTVKVPLNLP